MTEQNIFAFDTIALDDDASALVIIDQTKLPNKTEILHLTTQEEIWQAIYLLQVRGAPAIGVAAAYGIYLAAKALQDKTPTDFVNAFRKAKEYLNSSRPTAVNLSWALNRMEKVVDMSMAADVNFDVKLTVKKLKQEAVAIQEEDILTCQRIGEYGLSLLKPGMSLLTHCNAGQLATSRYGTATAPMYLGHKKGYNFKIYCDETRPLLQGARLTSYELSQAGMDVTVQCDNMAASLMKAGKIDAVLVGCDRVAANGDAANKIGTLPLAIAANRYNVPVYICAPISTIDVNCKTGADIVIEQRKGEEISEMWYKERMVPHGVKIYNPSFDVTDNDLITAIITEYGIAKPPFTVSFAEIMAKTGK